MHCHFHFKGHYFLCVATDLSLLSMSFAAPAGWNWHMLLHQAMRQPGSCFALSTLLFPCCLKSSLVRKCKRKSSPLIRIICNRCKSWRHYCLTRTRTNCLFQGQNLFRLVLAFPDPSTIVHSRIDVPSYPCFQAPSSPIPDAVGPRARSWWRNIRSADDK